MRARLMQHDGNTTINVPAETSRYFDTDLLDYVEQTITPAKVIEYKLPEGSKYGGYPVRKPVLVPPSMQNALVGKGFNFVNSDDEKEFLAERAKIEAEIEKRKAAAPPVVKLTTTEPPTTEDEGGN